MDTWVVSVIPDPVGWPHPWLPAVQHQGRHPQPSARDAVCCYQVQTALQEAFFPHQTAPRACQVCGQGNPSSRTHAQYTHCTDNVARSESAEVIPLFTYSINALYQAVNKCYNLIDESPALIESILGVHSASSTLIHAPRSGARPTEPAAGNRAGSPAPSHPRSPGAAPERAAAAHAGLL